MVMRSRILALLLTFIITVSCSDASSPSHPLSSAASADQPRRQPQPIDGETRALLSRTGFQLSGEMELLGVRAETGIDSQIAFAVRMPDSQVELFLKAAAFSTPLRAGRRVFQTPVDDVDTAGRKNVASAQDTYRADGLAYTRDVMVIRDHPDYTIVHVWAYTT